MMGSIKHKGLAALYYDDLTKGLQQSLVKRLRQILALLATVCTAEDMNVPGLKFHQLKGDLAGFYAVSVSGNRRVIFRLNDGKSAIYSLKEAAIAAGRGKPAILKAIQKGVISAVKNELGQWEILYS